MNKLIIVAGMQIHDKSTKVRVDGSLIPDCFSCFNWTCLVFPFFIIIIIAD